jgi:competence ComEA-like helix-hairpin-helix protein
VQKAPLPRKRPELLLGAVALLLAAGALLLLGAHGAASGSVESSASTTATAAASVANPFEPPAAPSDAAPGSYAVGYTGVVVAAAGGQQPPATQPAAQTPQPQYPVHLNSATQAQLETLPGIGSVKAQAILAWRAVHGSFSQPEQLLEINGIGEKTLARLLPYIVL